MAFLSIRLFSFNLIKDTRKPASRVFLAPLEGLTKFLSSLYHAWQLLLAKFFDLVKFEFWPPGPPSPLGVRGQIWIAYSVLSDGKVKPYQFGLATISGFQDHSSVPRIRTNRNQLVNIYMIILLWINTVNKTGTYLQFLDFLKNLNKIKHWSLKSNKFWEWLTDY